jgi:predicted acyltransferase (DUF342 family)
MLNILVAILFFVLTVGLIVFPFIPALVEWRKKRDMEPLRVVRDSQVDIRHFANRFREFVESSFGQALVSCRESRDTERGSLEDGTTYTILGDGDVQGLIEDTGRNGPYHSLVLSPGNIRLPGNTMFGAEIYSGGSIEGSDNCVLRAVLAEQDISLGRDNTTLRWLHGGGSVNVEEGCLLLGRVSADDTMRLEKGCCFERLNAPRIEFCGEQGTAEHAGRQFFRESEVLKPADVDNRVEATAGRWLVFGDLKIPSGKVVWNDLVVTGTLEVEQGVLITGSVKSRKEIRLSKGVDVEGNVVSEGDVHVAPGCRIGGLILSEEKIMIRGDTAVGSKEHPATVSGERIFIDPGVRVHGTVWAHQEGRVCAQGSGY